MRRLVPSLLFFVCLLAGGSALADASSGASPALTGGTPGPVRVGGGSADQAVVDVVAVSGVLDRTNRDYLVSKIEAADAAQHQVVIQLDSPGTSGVDAMALAERVAAAEVPVMVWVGPAGATAEGGAVLLAEAAGLASVAPGAGIGRMQPLDLRDADAPIPAGVRSQIEEWGTERGHGTALPQIETTLLTSQQVIDAGLTPVLQPDTPAPQTVLDFLEQVDGHEVATARGSVVVRASSSKNPEQGSGTIVGFKSLGPFVRILHAVASPTAIFLLLSLGFAGIAFELTQPGFGFAGISGVVALGLAVYGMLSVPPAPLGLALFLVGTIAMMLDVRWKRLSVLTWGGLVAYAASGFLSYPNAAPAIAISPWFVVSFVVAATLYYGFALTVAQQAHDRISDMQLALVGLPGEVRSDLNPVGGVVVKGTVWRARAMGEHLRAGARIRVKGVQGVVLQVESDPGGAADDEDVDQD